MNSKKVQFLEKILRLMAVLILKRHNPKIVAVSGSVGKTFAKNAIFAVLSSKFNVRKNKRRHSDKIGLPLSIIGVEDDVKGIVGWLVVGLKWLFVLISPKYPEILILELGIYGQGDMTYMMTFMEPYVGAVTNISEKNLENFKTVDNIAKEQRKLVESIDESGFVILNADDEKVSAMAERTKAKVITIGSDEKFSVSASNISHNYDGDRPDGISFKLNYDGNNIPIRLRNMQTPYSVYTALIATAIGIIFKMNLVEIGQAIEEIRLTE